jgi:hypothetical protein
MERLPIFEDRVYVASATGTNDYIDGERVRPGEVWEVTRMFALCNGHTATDARIGPYNGATHVVLANSAMGTSNVGVNFLGPIYLREGQNLRCHIIGATAADVLTFSYQYIKHVERE